MDGLSVELRGILLRAVLDARVVSEAAARGALETLGVDVDPEPGGLSEEQRGLRVALRPKVRQLGGVDALVREVAYEQWHRMLFARFLAENGSLMHPDGVAVSLQDCRELAQDLGEPDEWMVAARFAASMLPGVFRSGDPSLEVRFAQEGRVALEHILAGLPPTVFTADDSLGWVYQFWQTDAKNEVNRSERKIGGPDLAPVTQLFTEHYMVLFLLENSLGAWWAGRHPDSALLEGFEYLRRLDDGSPTAGTFEGWPKRVAEVTVMDPCCGSGHFLVAAFEILRTMRMEEEGLDAASAGDAVLRENLFGLELDARCTQIAAFAVALAAWKSGGYRELPEPNIACSGIRIEGQFPEWKKLARGDTKLEAALYQLFQLFGHAPDLGSLIDPVRELELGGSLLVAPFEEVEPLLEKALARETTSVETKAAGIAAAGIAHAAQLLTRPYTLVATNVPYLGIQRMADTLAEYVTEHYPDAANDLATSFIERCLALADPGSAALVTPLGWLFLRYFAPLRRSLLATVQWNVLAPLGKGAFEGISGEVVQSALLILTPGSIPDDLVAIDGTTADGVPDKLRKLRDGEVLQLSQAVLANSPDTILALENSSTRPMSDCATSWQGLVTSDVARFIVRFWEVPELGEVWERFLTAPSRTDPYSGRERLLRWESGVGSLVKDSGAHNFNPKEVLGKRGVLVAQGSLRVTLYLGEMFNDASSPVIPQDESVLPALWAYMSSPEYAERLRRINHKIIVGSGYLVKVPFDSDRWRRVAEEAGSVAEPFSDDPTQWLFNGQPKGSTEPLQVAVARLVGYRWPDQELDQLDDLADPDGIVPLPALAGELGAAERLRRLLERAFGDELSPAKLARLLTEAGAGEKSLAEWLRDGFFDAHLKVFEQRPFVWQISDGRGDGFSVLVNYHRLDRQLLDKLTYATLGHWIEIQRAELSEDKTGADLRLAAAQALQSKLAGILEGEAPYDIYVRWKPLAEQPIGWEPDLDDGVRLNIRPFVEAGILRRSPKIKWTKDRGKDLDGRERHNDIHLTIAEKRTARGGS